MVEISIIRDNEGKMRGFNVEGHAGYARKGEDIVCSAVSALAYTAVGSLMNMAGGCDYEEKDGFMKIRIKDRRSEKETISSEIILNTIFIGFMQLMESYKKFVRVSEG